MARSALRLLLLAAPYAAGAAESTNSSNSTTDDGGNSTGTDGVVDDRGKAGNSTSAANGNGTSGNTTGATTTTFSPTSSTTTLGPSWAPVEHQVEGCPKVLVEAVPFIATLCNLHSQPHVRVSGDGTETVDAHTLSAICSSPRCITRISEVYSIYRSCPASADELGVQARYARALNGATGACLRSSIRSSHAVFVSLIALQMDVSTQTAMNYAMGRWEVVVANELEVTPDMVKVQLHKRATVPTTRRLEASSDGHFEVKLAIACQEAWGGTCEDLLARTRSLKITNIQKDLQKAGRGLSTTQVTAMGVPLLLPLDTQIPIQTTTTEEPDTNKDMDWDRWMPVGAAVLATSMAGLALGWCSVCIVTKLQKESWCSSEAHPLVGSSDDSDFSSEEELEGGCMG